MSARQIVATDIDAFLSSGYSVLSQVALNSLRQVVADVFNGTGGPRLIPVFGDSTMAGVGIGTGGASLANGARARTWLATLAKTLTARGIPAKINSFFGDSNMTQFTTYPLYNPQVSLGAGWVSNSLAIPGGFAFTFTNVGGGGFNNASSTLSFTPPDQVDSFTIYWAQRSGTATVNVDGGAALTVASGLGAGGTTVTIPASPASFANMSSSFTVTKGAHTINVVVQSGTTTDVMGIRAFDSTSNYLDLMPVPASGAKITGFDNPSATFRDGKYFTSYVTGASMLWINLTVNDTTSGTTGASYTTSLNSMKQFNPVPWAHLLGPYVNAMSDVISNAVVQAIMAYAATNNQPVIDFSTRWRGGATNLTGGDNIHPTWGGHGDIARYLAFQAEGI